MAEELRALADRAEISDLLARYSTALDTRDWPLMDQVFTLDASCDYGRLGNPSGREKIVALVRTTLETLDATQHLIGNVTSTVVGDTATAECYLIAQHIRAGAAGGEHYLLGGRYSDRLVRTPDGWRIVQRTLHRMWATGNREVVQRPVSA